MSARFRYKVFVSWKKMDRSEDIDNLSGRIEE